MRCIRTLLGAALVAVGCGPQPEPVRVARLAYPHEMVSLDPHGQNDAVTGTILSAVYEALVTFSPTEGPQPCLALEWSNPEPTVWRFRLRDDVVFHDGRPLSAADVVASLNRVRFDFGLAVATYVEPVTEVHQVTGQEALVEIVTRAPTPLLLSRLAMIAITQQHLDPQRPTGTGPYRWASGRERGPVVLRRWERYWGEAPAMDEVRISFVDDDGALAPLIDAGELDVMAGVSIDFVRTRGLPEGWRLVEIPSGLTMLLGVNVLRPPLDDPRVRHAIDLAIDRGAMVEAAFPGSGAVPARALAPASQHPTAMPRARHDPQQARDLLAEAGVAPGTRLRVQHLAVPRPVIEALDRDLATIGLEVEPVASSYESKYRRLTAAQRSELFVFGWNFRLGDPSNFLDSMVHSRDAERRLGLLNGSGYSDPEVDRWLDRAAQEPDPARRTELLELALERVHRDRPYLPLYHYPRLALVRRPFSFEIRRGLLVFPQDIVVEQG